MPKPPGIPEMQMGRRSIGQLEGGRGEREKGQRQREEQEELRENERFVNKQGGLTLVDI